MKVGDLVTFGGIYKGDAVGIIIRCIPGWSRAKVVVWMDEHNAATQRRA